jgi:hypothetical protein
MKYSSEIIIKLPINECLKKLDNSENLKYWQNELISYEYLSGVPGKLGSRMELKYKIGKHERALIETITFNNLPDEIHMTYDTKGLHNIQKNFFSPTPEGHTKWICKNEFLPTTFMFRMMTLLMPNAFKKQSLKYLKDFKAFAENDNSEKDA